MPAIPGVPTTILVAPDSFKGTLSAAEVAAAIGRGLEATGRPVDLCPWPMEAKARSRRSLEGMGGEQQTATVSDPLGRPIEAAFAVGAGGVGIVETAAASGLGLVDAARPRPRGGEHLRDRRADRGGGGGGRRTSSTSASAGAPPPTAARARSRPSASAVDCSGARIVVLSDVRTPFEHAARVFAPQKGADPSARWRN